MERNAYFDNAKLLLIFFVVFGHMIQPFIDDSVYVGTFYTWLYTFHMPAFIFLAGFYAKGKNSLDFILSLAKKLLIPYLIFQAIYTIYYFYIGKSGWLTEDRKSTRLNSSHVSISYAVFFLRTNIGIIGY